MLFARIAGVSCPVHMCMTVMYLEIHARQNGGKTDTFSVVFLFG